MSPCRRPVMRMRSEAGTVDSAIPTTARETGVVAHEGSGARSALNIPPNSTTAVKPEPVSTWASTSMGMFDMSFGLVPGNIDRLRCLHCRMRRHIQPKTLGRRSSAECVPRVQDQGRQLNIRKHALRRLTPGDFSSAWTRTISSCGRRTGCSTNKQGSNWMRIVSTPGDISWEIKHLISRDHPPTASAWGRT